MVDNLVQVKVSGEFACFSRPEMKVERVSYEVITPSAARGILDAILWKPEMRWHVMKIKVLKPIRFQALKRNEMINKVSPTTVRRWMRSPKGYQPQLVGSGLDGTTPRNTLALRNVSYIIEAEPIVYDTTGDNTPRKYVEMFRRRVNKGQCYAIPCLGCREFAARFESVTGDEKPILDSRQLGWMLYDIIFDPAGKNNRALFFEAVMANGVVCTAAEKVLPDEQLRKEVLSCSYNH